MLSIVFFNPENNKKKVSYFRSRVHQRIKSPRKCTNFPFFFVSVIAKIVMQVLPLRYDSYSLKSF